MYFHKIIPYLTSGDSCIKRKLICKLKTFCLLKCQQKYRFLFKKQNLKIDIDFTIALSFCVHNCKQIIHDSHVLCSYVLSDHSHFFPSEWIGLGILNLTAEQWPAHHTNCSVLVLLMFLTVQKKHSFCHQLKKKIMSYGFHGCLRNPAL